jgi:cell division septal protein FtsQ
MAKRHDNVRLLLYFALLALLVLILVLHIFVLWQLQTDFFAKFMISLVAVVALLPVVARIKFFDMVEVTKGTRFMVKKKGGKVYK